MSTTIATDSTPNSPPATDPRPWRKAHAFGLPEGSIRAALALAVFATLWVVLVRHPDRDVPDYLRDLLFIIMGHYFASRRRAPSGVAAGPGPFFLPRGTIRVILFGGFALVAVALGREGRLQEPMKYPAVVTLMLVGGFLLGVALAKVGDWWADRGHFVPRWVEDAKALVAIVAALGLIALVWNHLDPILVPRRADLFDKMNLRLGTFGPEHLLGAVVGFYFGSKS